MLRTLGQVWPARRAAGVALNEGTEARTISLNKSKQNIFRIIWRVTLFVQLQWVGWSYVSLGNIYFIFTGNFRQPRCGNPSSRHSVMLHFLSLVLMV